MVIGQSPRTALGEAESLLAEDLLSPIAYFSESASSIGSSEDSPQIDATSETFYDNLDYIQGYGSVINKEFFESTNDHSFVFPGGLEEVIPGFTLLSKISNDFFRGFNRKTKRSVLVKYTPLVTPGTTTRYLNEWYMLSGLNASKSPFNGPRTLPKDIEGILYPTDFIKLENNGGLALIYEDVLNLKTLKEVFVHGLVRSDEKVLMAIVSCLKILKKIHKYHLTHNGLSSNTILINDYNEVYITGWDFSFNYSTEDCSKGYRTINKRFLIDWLPYMAPEVSGEINRLTDYRSDLYSIGVVLYEIFTKSLPLFASDSRELINKLIKEMPADPSEFGVPEFLSKVIMKALSKEAFDRYQDCEFMIDDLRYALSHNPSAPVIPDKTIRITLPRGVYGRGKELRFIEKVCLDTKPGVNMLLLTGESGSGKTRLINEIQSAILIRGRRFASWKCSSRRTGFSCFISLLYSILHQIMAGSESDIGRAREDIIQLAGTTDFTLLFKHLPDLKELLGVHYTKHIASFEAQDNFLVKSELELRVALKRLFLTLGKRSPLVICFDDLQFFPLADLELLNEISAEIFNNDIECSIAIIATFDVSYSTELSNYKKNFPVFREIELQQIPFESYHDYVRTALSPSSEYSLRPGSDSASISRDFTEDIARRLHDKTKGNLLVTQGILANIAIIYSDRAWSLPCWNVEPEEIDTMEGNFNDVCTRRLSMFNEEDLELLKIASCFKDSPRFSLRDLSVAANRPIDHCAIFLSKSVEAKLIQSSSVFYKFPFHIKRDQLPFEISETVIEELSGLALYTFSHDSVITYIHSELMTQMEIQEHHKLVGLRLYANVLRTSETIASSNTLMDIAKHLTNSHSVVEDEAECQIYLTIFNAARKVSSKVYDFNMMLVFLKLERIILNKLDSSDKQKLYEIHIETVRCLLLSKDYIGCVEFIESHWKSFQDDPQIVLYRIESLAMLSRGDEGLAIGFEFLNKEGITVNSDTAWLEENIPLLQSRLPQSITDIRAFVSTARKTSSKNVIILHQIISELIFLLNPLGRILESTVLHHTLAVHSIEYGLSDFSAVAFVGVAVSQLNRSTARSKEYAQLSLQLLKSKTVSLDFINKVFYEYCVALGCLLNPIQELLTMQETITSSASQLTSSVNIAWCMRVIVKPILQLNVGVSINSIYSYLIKTVTTSDLEDKNRRFAFKASITFMRYFLQLPQDDQYDVFAEFKYEDLGDIGVFLRVFYYSIALMIKPRSIDKKIFGVMKEKIEHFNEVLPHNTLASFFGSHDVFNQIDDPIHNSIEDNKKSLTNILKFCDDCSYYSPDYYEHRIFIVQTELLRFENASDLEILDGYAAAISSAKKVGYVNGCAIYNERCASWLYKNTKSVKRTISHLKEAIYYANLAGNAVIISKIKEKYSDIFEDVREEVVQKKSSDLGSIAPLNYLLSSVLANDKKNGSAKNSFHAVDPEFLINASLAISESINIDSIVENLVKHTITTLDAEFAVVGLVDSTNAVEFKAIAGAGYYKALDGSKANLSIPEGLIQQVIESGTPADNFQDLDFEFDDSKLKFDPYFFKFIPRSLCCIPIKNELQTLGAIYLESSKADKPFNKGKMELVSLLCTQAAFSIDKARLYQSTMAAKKEAEEATAEKAAFLANMSHEIRTPFNSLFACAGFLKETKLDPLQMEYVETIQSSAKVTLNIIDAILTFSKIEHGSLLLDQDIFSINECLESSMQLIAEQAVKKGLSLVYFNRSEGSDLVKGDSTRFKQIIINLLGNAVKFTQEGSIIVDLASKSVNHEDLYEFTISIKDTGIGIPKNSHSRVFGAFSQVDGSSRRVYGGSGLGLAISKKLVELMGGSLTFESDEGEGTTFNFSIIASVTSNPESNSKRYGNGSKVLIIDSIDQASDSLKLELEKTTDFEVGVVEDALKIDTLKDYALVFLNLNQYASLPQRLYDTIEKKSLVLMSAYGSVISEKVQLQKHPVLLLPYQRQKLKRIIESVCSPGAKPISRSTTPVEKKPELKIDTTFSSKVPLKRSHLSQNYPLRILLVEDNMINTRVALQHLKRFGFSADSAAHGIEALEKCEELVDSESRNYDLILMDLQMPFKDGITTAIDIREKYQEKEHLLPVIVALTANVEREERDRCIACGMVDFINKPILPKVLEKVLESVGQMRFASDTL